jgi:hypothetical protein
MIPVLVLDDEANSKVKEVGNWEGRWHDVTTRYRQVATKACWDRLGGLATTCRVTQVVDCLLAAFRGVVNAKQSGESLVTKDAPSCGFI